MHRNVHRYVDSIDMALDMRVDMGIDMAGLTHVPRIFENLPVGEGLKSTGISVMQLTF